MIRSVILMVALLSGLGIGMSFAQEGNVYVDDQGLMRWGDTREEVQGFGVNYTVPFAHAYRSAEKLGISPKEAIDKDIYHFARLGFDAYRVHIWDTEISDTLGNLLENEHLDVFDYMLRQMKDRGMKFLLTPIAFWGNGWPERDSWSPGFAHKYGKDVCLTNEEAIKAQENYLYQLLNHVNPYTGLAYKDDPAIVAFEVSNEPHHRQEPDSVTRYIRKMVGAMRRTGCEKPVFYNISHSIHLVDAYFDAGVQGGTFQWYPTGLGAGEELQGNFLPNVDRYDIPFADNPAFRKVAKVVYEFDAADVGRSYIYPAMARSFRTAGIQWATHFAYDPTYLAYANTEYNTHYMNLAYTPQKALSLKIAGEVFHRVPVYKDYGRYPENSRFDDFRVSYEEDLAELVTEEKFIYTNHTTNRPGSEQKLVELAGYGNSPLVNYDGTGAYFLDKIEKGIWRLEVMPDAAWIADPFGKNSLNRKLAVIDWRTRRMKIILAELGEGFSVRPISEGNNWQPEVPDNAFNVRPGTYLIVKAGTKTPLTGSEKWKNIRLNEFSAPAATLEQDYVLHEPALQTTEGEAYEVKADIIMLDEPSVVNLLTYAGWRPVTFEMKRGHGYEYTATIPAEYVKAGFLRYFITVSDKGTYPGGLPGQPGDWDFDASAPYSVAVVPDSDPVYLFDALADHEELVRKWTRESSVVPLAAPGSGEVRVVVPGLFEKDPENPAGQEIQDYSMRYTFKEKVAGRRASLSGKQELVLRGRALTGKNSPLQLALVMPDGKAFGGLVELGSDGGEYRLPLASLKEVPLVTLPRPYPTFLSYFFQGASDAIFNIEEAETLQISIGPGLVGDSHATLGVAIQSIWLE